MSKILTVGIKYKARTAILDRTKNILYPDAKVEHWEFNLEDITYWVDSQNILRIEGKEPDFIRIYSHDWPSEKTFLSNMDLEGSYPEKILTYRETLVYKKADLIDDYKNIWDWVFRRKGKKEPRLKPKYYKRKTRFEFTYKTNAWSING